MNDLKTYFLENKNGSRLKSKSLEKENPELYLEICEYSKKNGFTELPFKEMVWLFVNYVNEKPKCKVCSSDTNFDKFGTGYREYCSIKCKSISGDVKEKIKTSFNNKYGGHPMKNEKIKEKVEKTNLERYGHKSHLSSENIKNKIEKTNIERYGVKRPLNSDEIFDKTKKTMLKIYGVEHGLQSKGIHEKTIKSLKENGGYENIVNKTSKIKEERYGSPNYNNSKKNRATVQERYGVNSVLDSNSPFRDVMGFNKLKNSIKKYEHGDKIDLVSVDNPSCTIECLSCGETIIENRHFLTIRGNRGSIICTNCKPKGVLYSNPELELGEFLKEFNHLVGDRKILGGKELDIFIPTKNLAIEYNGLYWHSDNFLDQEYHLNKTISCNKKGINLLQIFEDEWLNKKDIVKSIINTKLNKFDNVIWGRKCVIKEIDPKTSEDFLNKNHIQGNIKSKIKIGLFHDDELVSVMTFGSNRVALGFKDKNINHYEMLRFCNKINHKIVGGASKLFKFFIKKYKPEQILSYSDNRYFSGELYEKLGFDFIGDTKPSYWYVKNDKRFHRFGFRKDILVKMGFDPNKTEKEIMYERGFKRIWDCGNKKWLITIH